MLFLKILGGVAALALGIWLGLPGRYEQTPDDIDAIMATGTARRRRTKRYFTPLAWIQRKISVGTSGRGRGGRGFKLERPEDR